jgi:hypothetical protein
MEAFGAPPTVEPAFNSFFGDQGSGEQQSEQARQILMDWKGPGALIVISHQVNITALTGIFPASGQGLVLAGNGKGLTLLGRIKL